ncbi:c-type cytochrome [Atopomonas sediminilitoris]|uniref:c-type cytochrome n=1 Tax=Atopomonas sediminilitoris TaxID=2919919 RepID=UPI001F4E42DD|nr:c-type cytochrome [Atopomonas sediminilitoris]MCJ8169521.1 c-type cytochrome [Atopomonas sediminilitoris]
MKKLLIALSMATFASAFVAPVSAAQDPEAVFTRACGACHNGQLPTAPKKGDTAVWQQRIEEKGMETLVQHVTNGFNAMPPRGLCMDCSAEDYQAVIEWMAK